MGTTTEEKGISVESQTENNNGYDRLKKETQLKFPENFYYYEGKSPSYERWKTFQPLPDMCVNPGLFETLHDKCLGVFPKMFEGGELSINRRLSNHFLVRHSFFLGTAKPYGYRFGSYYSSVPCGKPIIKGDIDLAGNLNARFDIKIRPNIVTQIIAQTEEHRFSKVEWKTHFIAHDFTLTTIVKDPSILPKATLFCQYLQAFSCNFACGAELVYKFAACMRAAAIVSGAFRYVHDKFTVTGSAGNNGVHLCYYQKADDLLDLGAEFYTLNNERRAYAALGYHVKLPALDTDIYGSINSDWLVGVLLEKKLAPSEIKLKLSGTLNHLDNKFLLGIGLCIG